MEVILREHVDNLGTPRRGREGRRRLRAQLPAAAQAGAARSPTATSKQIERETASSPRRARPRSGRRPRRSPTRIGAGRDRDRAPRRRDRRAVRLGDHRPTSPRRSPPRASRSIAARSSSPSRSRSSASTTCRSSCTATSRRQVEGRRRQGSVTPRAHGRRATGSGLACVATDSGLVECPSVDPLFLVECGCMLSPSYPQYDDRVSSLSPTP